MNIKTFYVWNRVLPKKQARLLMGPPGIGKSQAIKQYADSIGYEFVDLRLTELEPADLVGLPFIKKDDLGVERTYYAAPSWWPNDGKKVVLLLDEMDRAREDMQPIAMQLSLDRRAGGRNLPEDVIIFAACNGERFMTSPIDQALINRFAVIDFTPTKGEWISWASKNNIHESVINFIRSNKKMLDTPDSDIGKSNVQVPTRRSWTGLARAMTLLENECESNKEFINHPAIYDIATSFVGLSAATLFTKWVKENYHILNAEEVFSGKLKADKNLDILQISNIVSEVAEIFVSDSTTDIARGNCLKFFISAGHEAFAALFAALPIKAGQMIERHKFADEYIRNHKKKLDEEQRRQAEKAKEQS